MKAIDTISQIDAERDMARFQAMAQRFFKKWSPQDNYDKAEFNADFYSLVRQIYMDAQQPLLDRLAHLSIYAAHPAFMIKEPEKAAS